MTKSSTNSKCQQYLNAKRRISNKERQLAKLLKTIKKEESKAAIKKSCRIGRVKEGFKVEDFKPVRKRK
jgi:hypothetical protein